MGADAAVAHQRCERAAEITQEWFGDTIST